MNGDFFGSLVFATVAHSRSIAWRCHRIGQADAVRGYGGVKQKHASNSSKIERVSKMAKNLGITIKYMHRAKLSKFCGGRPHQNVVLKCDRLEYENIRSMKDLLKVTTN